MRLRRGSILLITLWLVAVLSALALAIASHVALELRVVKYRIAQAQARALAQGGVRLAAALVQRDPTSYDWPGDEWAAGITRQPPGYPVSAEAPIVTVTVTDEDRYLNLNALSAEDLSGLGIPPQTAQAIFEDRDVSLPDPPPDLSRPYRARNAAFDQMEELADVPGMTVAVVEQLRRAVSPYRGDSKTINLNTATTEALRGMRLQGPGTKFGAVQAVETYRAKAQQPGAKGPDGIFTKQDDIVAFGLTLRDEDRDILIQQRAEVASKVFAIKSDGHVPNSSAHYTIQAVVKRLSSSSSGTTPAAAPTVLSWREG